MANDTRIRVSYIIIVAWRKLVYKRILLNRYIPPYISYTLTTMAYTLGNLIYLLNPDSGRTRRYMQNWKDQTSALFSPEITPISIYAKSTTDARIALSSTDFGTSGAVIFFSHGAFLIQNVSSVLSEIALKSNHQFINVLIFRRHVYPHVEEWWKAYALCFRINLKIIHNDTLHLIDESKNMLGNGDIVLCAPDYFFSDDIAFQEAIEMYEKTASIFMRMAESNKSDVLYINCCNQAKYDAACSILTTVEEYNPMIIRSLFEDEITKHPNEWFFSYNHYKSINAWN